MKKKIVFADNNYISIYQEQVDEILEILGFEGAMVTNLSKIGDFLFPKMILKDKTEVGFTTKEIDDIIGQFNFPVFLDDYVWEIAKKIKDQE